MSISGIGTGTGALAFFRNRSLKAAQQNFSAQGAVEETDGGNDSRVIGLTMIMDENSKISYGMRAQYAEDSTKENPIIQVTGNEGGKSTSYRVSINEIDPSNASNLEMFALCSYADDRGRGIGTTFGTYQTIKNFARNAELNGYCKKTDGTAQFISQKLDWTQIVEQMNQDYYNAGAMGQYKNGQKLLRFLSGFWDAGNETGRNPGTPTVFEEEPSKNQQPGGKCG